MATPDEQDGATLARRALEEVCALGDFAKAEQFYGLDFHDRVNSLEFHGLDGVRRSVSLYRSVFPDLTIEVQDQVVDDDRVASRWVARGTNRGRTATLTGITISRVGNGRIVEDWTVTDTAGLLRQLGLLRVIGVGLDQVLAWVRDRR